MAGGLGLVFEKRALRVPHLSPRQVGLGLGEEVLPVPMRCCPALSVFGRKAGGWNFPIHAQIFHHLAINIICVNQGKVAKKRRVCLDWRTGN